MPSSTAAKDKSPDVLRGSRRAAHPSRRLGRLRHPLVARARAGDRAPGQGLLGVRRARHRLRPARGREPRRARPDLPLDGADPVVAARRRAVRARRHRRRLPQPGDHDARAPLQPDEAEPRRRARSRPHHPRRDPGPRPRLARVPAGARRPDPDDGPHLRRAPERGRRREGDPLGLARRGRDRHRRPRPGGGRYDYTQIAPMVEAARAPGSGSRSTSARRARPAARSSARSSSTCGPTGSATASSPPRIRS